MDNYLFLYRTENTFANKVINALLKKYELVFMDFYGNSDINSILYFEGCLLSEFPGNCSTLVLSRIQSRYETEILKNILEFSIEVCITLKYANLIITTTDRNFVEYLNDNYDFREAYNLINFHSSRRNYFLIREITNDQITEYDANNVS